VGVDGKQGNHDSHTGDGTEHGKEQDGKNGFVQFIHKTEIIGHQGTKKQRIYIIS
jgi:hypothetical protein